MIVSVSPAMLPGHRIGQLVNFAVSICVTTAVHANVSSLSQIPGRCQHSHFYVTIITLYSRNVLQRTRSLKADTSQATKWTQHRSRAS